MNADKNKILTPRKFIKTWMKKNKNVEVFIEDISPMELMEVYWDNKASGDLKLFEDLDYAKIVNLESFFVILLHQEFIENEFPVNKL